MICRQLFKDNCETIAVIDYNGEVRACELREKFGSLKDFDYDFNALWQSEARAAELFAARASDSDVAGLVNVLDELEGLGGDLDPAYRALARAAQSSEARLISAPITMRSAVAR